MKKKKVFDGGCSKTLEGRCQGRKAIDLLNFDRLAAAAKAIHETNTHNDPTIRLLERQIQAIALQVPQSFASILMLRPSFALDCHYTLHIAIADS